MPFLGKCLLWSIQGDGGEDEGRDRRRSGELWKKRAVALGRCGSKKYRYKSDLRARSSWL